MKIVYISSSLIPSRTANSIQVMKMCEAFAKNGHEVTLVARKGSSMCESDYAFYGVTECFEIKKLPWPFRKGGGVIYGLHCLRYLAREKPPDLTYGRSVYGALAAVRLGLPCIYEAHTPPHDWIHFALEKTLFRARTFKWLIVISRALKQRYKELYPWLGDEMIVVAPDGADLPSEQAQLLPVTDWPGREGAMQVGYVGHLYPGRGVEVISELANRLASMDFHVIGGTDEDVRRWRSRTLCNNLFFHGFVPPRDTSRYRAMCDVLLLPYQRKVAVAGGKGDTSKWMSPLKMFEYMASGKAIIASRLSVIEEILEDRRNALLVQPEDIGEWQAALRSLESDEELRKRLAARAYADLAAEYTWTARARNVLGVEEAE